MPDNSALIQQLRTDIVGELQTINQYDQHIASTTDVVAKRVLSSVRDEEKVHVGELLMLLNYLDPSENTHLESGFNEAMEIMKTLGVGGGKE